MRLAILRLDCNHYEDHLDALYFLYSFVPVGGYVIFDDVFAGPIVRQAAELPKTLNPQQS